MEKGNKAKGYGEGDRMRRVIEVKEPVYLKLLELKNDKIKSEGKIISFSQLIKEALDGSQ